MRRSRSSVLRSSCIISISVLLLMLSTACIGLGTERCTMLALHSGVPLVVVMASVGVAVGWSMAVPASAVVGASVVMTSADDAAQRHPAATIAARC